MTGNIYVMNLCHALSFVVSSLLVNAKTTSSPRICCKYIEFVRIFFAPQNEKNFF